MSPWFRRGSSAESSPNSSVRCRLRHPAHRPGSTAPIALWQLALNTKEFLRHNTEVTIQAGTLVPRDARDFGAYQLIAKLATGGMAEIFLARRNGSSGGANDIVVLKRILPHLAEDEHFVTMFRDEARLASRLEHVNVGKVHNLGHVGTTWFIVM